MAVSIYDCKGCVYVEWSCLLKMRSLKAGALTCYIFILEYDDHPLPWN